MGSDSARAGSKALPSVKPLASGASDILTPAQQRELERESAYQASTGSAAASLTGTTSTASGKAKGSQPSWDTIAAQSDGNTAQGGASTGGLGKPGSVSDLGQSSSTGKQQSLGDIESDADMEDYDPRAFATGSTTDSVTRTAGANPTGQALGWNPRTSGANTGARVQPSMGGEEAYDELQEEEWDSRNFVATRDPTDPNSVVNAQLGRDAQLHQHSTGVNAAGAGVTRAPSCPAVAVFSLLHVPIMHFDISHNQPSRLVLHSVVCTVETHCWHIVLRFAGCIAFIPCHKLTHAHRLTPGHKVLVAWAYAVCPANYMEAFLCFVTYL